MKNGMHMVSPRQPTCYLPNNLATAITIKRLSAFSLHPGSIQTSLQRHVDVEQVFETRHVPLRWQRDGIDS
jgi:hypothetical protein